MSDWGFEYAYEFPIIKKTQEKYYSIADIILIQIICPILVLNRIIFLSQRKRNIWNRCFFPLRSILLQTDQKFATSNKQI